MRELCEAARGGTASHHIIEDYHLEDTSNHHGTEGKLFGVTMIDHHVFEEDPRVAAARCHHASEGVPLGGVVEDHRATEENFSATRRRNLSSSHPAVSPSIGHL